MLWMEQSLYIHVKHMEDITHISLHTVATVLLVSCGILVDKQFTYNFSGGNLIRPKSYCYFSWLTQKYQICKLKAWRSYSFCDIISSIIRAYGKLAAPSPSLNVAHRLISQYRDFFILFQPLQLHTWRTLISSVYISKLMAIM